MGIWKLRLLKITLHESKQTLGSGYLYAVVIVADECKMIYPI